MGAAARRKEAERERWQEFRKGVFVLYEDVRHFDVERHFRLDLESNALVRMAPGVYRWANKEATWRHRVAVAAVKYKRGVLCLEAAARLHELSWTDPDHVWMSLPQDTHVPAETPLGVKFVSDPARLEDWQVETVEVLGIAARIHSVPRLVAESFRHRDIVGMEFAIRALRTAIRWTGPEPLIEAAQVLRVEKIVRSHIAEWRHDEREDARWTDEDDDALQVDEKTGLALRRRRGRPPTRPVARRRGLTPSAAATDEEEVEAARVAATRGLGRSGKIAG